MGKTKKNVGTFRKSQKKKKNWELLKKLLRELFKKLPKEIFKEILKGIPKKYRRKRTAGMISYYAREEIHVKLSEQNPEEMTGRISGKLKLKELPEEFAKKIIVILKRREEFPNILLDIFLKEPLGKFHFYFCFWTCNNTQ